MPAAATSITSTSIPRRSIPTSRAPAAASPTTTATIASSPSSPGAYPWGNHENAWRPAHIHFSVFGRAFTQRLVTQMYFPGDPLFRFDPIFNSVRNPAARALLVSEFDLDSTKPDWALAFRWNIVLGHGGSGTTPLEEDDA